VTRAGEPRTAALPPQVLLLIGVFLATFLSNEDGGWPNLPDTLVGVTGVAAAAYVAGKAVDKSVTGPTVRDVVPRKAAVDDVVRIYAVNIARVGATDVHVTFDGIEGAATTTLSDDVAVVAATVPSGVSAGPVKIRVTGPDGQGVDWTDFTVI